jgi:hypothetical protein
MVIYKYTNKINGKVYIGKTEARPSKRHRRHFTEARKGTSGAFYNAIRKYGWKNFQYEIIDGANSSSELSYKEIHYIYKYNTLYPNGYNLTLGNKKHTTSINKQKKSIKANVGNSLRMKYLTELSRVKICKKVVTIHVVTGERVHFSSIIDACKTFNQCPKIIGYVLSGKRVYRPYNGYLFEYEDGSTIKLKQKRPTYKVKSTLIGQG